VTLRVRHPSGVEAALPITRAQITMQTVRGPRRGADEHWDFMLDPVHAIGYIRIGQFTDTTAGELKAALAQLQDRQFRGLILDLRFNPGGLLESAVQVGNMFLPAGQRIVSVRGRVVPETVYTSTGAGLIAPVPVVVLANESSASAAEIVTGALSDNHRARFVGTRTFGKGSVQQVRALENGEGALKITNAYYYLPNGRNIHRRKDKDVWGVDPDEGCYVSMTAQQVEAMVKTRNAGDILGVPGATTEPAVTPDSIRRDMQDPQLAAALRSVLGKLADGHWPVVGLSQAQALALETQRAGLLHQREALTERLGQVDQELEKIEHAATRPADSHPTTLPASQP
jgi:carboxyl-terminal processing protease